MRVELDYFKTNGTYCSSGTLEVPDFMSQSLGGLSSGIATPLFEIWAIVRLLQYEKSLPGLKEGHSDFTVLVNVPKHPHDHPYLVIPGAHDPTPVRTPFTKLKE